MLALAASTGLLAALDPQSRVMYTSPDTIRKRLYAALLSPGIASLLQGYLRDAVLGHRTRDQLARNRESVTVMQNVVHVILAAATDLLGLPRVRPRAPALGHKRASRDGCADRGHMFSVRPGRRAPAVPQDVDNDMLSGGFAAPPAVLATPTATPTHIFTSDDMPLLRALQDITDVFVTLGAVRDLPFASTLPSDPDGLLQDVQLLLVRRAGALGRGHDGGRAQALT